MGGKQRQAGSTAYHEAGHAVAAYLLRLRFGYVTIVSRENGPLGQCTLKVRLREICQRWADSRPVRRGDIPHLKRAIVSCLAGWAAEERQTGGNQLLEEQDSDDAKQIAYFITNTPDDAIRLLDSSWEEAKALWESPANWAAVQSLACVLLETRQTGYRQTRRIIADAIERGAQPAQQ